MKRIEFDSNVSLLNGFFKANVKSAAGNFYQLQVPEELNMGNWGAKVRFYNHMGELVYYRPAKWVHEVSSNSGQLEFVKWSDDGQYCAFYEFDHGALYDLVVVSIFNRVEYRTSLENLSIDWNKLDSFSWEKLRAEIAFERNDLPIHDYEDKSDFFPTKWFPNYLKLESKRENTLLLRVKKLVIRCLSVL